MLAQTALYRTTRTPPPMPQLTSIVQALFIRDLEALKREVAAFPDDAALWVTRPGVTNTAGTLALHCAGNIQHFIGARLGGTGYVRQRDAEFARPDLPRALRVPPGRERT